MSKVKLNQIITFGNYNWKVIDIRDDRFLIITENIIAQKEFNSINTEVTWETSSIRKFLNSEFYDNFTEAEKSKILLVKNVNKNNHWYDSNGGKSTYDYIFLLSLEDVALKYFGDSSKNLFNKSPQQRYWFQKKDLNNEKRVSSYKNQIWWWWLRSPGRDNKRAVYIHGDGNIGIQGNGTHNYKSKTIHPASQSNCGGVRPALWIKTDSSEK